MSWINPNPVAAVIAAHLQSLLTHGNMELRYSAKRRLLINLPSWHVAGEPPPIVSD
jgi:hypothetical protein